MSLHRASRALLGLALVAFAGDAVALGGGERLRVELSPTSARIGFGGGARRVDWRVEAGFGREKECVWVEGRHEERLEEVWIEAREVRTWVPAEHRVVRDACGRERLVLARPGYWRVERVPGRHETVLRRVWVPGHWERRHQPWGAWRDHCD